MRVFVLTLSRKVGALYQINQGSHQGSHLPKITSNIDEEDPQVSAPEVPSPSQENSTNCSIYCCAHRRPEPRARAGPANAASRTAPQETGPHRYGRSPGRPRPKEGEEEVVVVASVTGLQAGSLHHVLLPCGTGFQPVSPRHEPAATAESPAADTIAADPREWCR